ncbi:MAG: carbon storage regulator [bacterium]|nr:carbon storage regulator [bacterium]
MLVLTRKKDQSIVIGDSIVVRVLSIGNRRVKLGIEAPPSVSVMREEMIELQETARG